MLLVGLLFFPEGFDDVVGGREQLFCSFGHALVLGVDFNLFEVFFELVKVSVPDLGDSARFSRGHTADAVHRVDQAFGLHSFHVRSPVA